ncbi:thiosulfate oxidation carrier protein SoxY, partial [uncultured Lamprocystis sp.]
MIDATRRILLKGSLAAGSVGVAVAAGLLTPRLVLAEWNAAAFESKDVSAALKGLLGSDAMETNDAVVVKAPDIAENGAVVPVTVETTLSDISYIAIIASGNA